MPGLHYHPPAPAAQPLPLPGALPPPRSACPSGSQSITPKLDPAPLGGGWRRASHCPSAPTDPGPSVPQVPPHHPGCQPVQPEGEPGPPGGAGAGGGGQSGSLELGPSGRAWRAPEPPPGVPSAWGALLERDWAGAGGLWAGLGASCGPRRAWGQTQRGDRCGHVPAL